MFVLGDIFPNSGNVSGSGGALATSGVFLSTDYGIAPLYSLPVYFTYSTSLPSLTTFPNSGSAITGTSSGNPSGSFLLIDYGFASLPSYLIQGEGVSGSVSSVFTIKPYGYFFRIK